MFETAERAGIEEQYLGAVVTSDLSDGSHAALVLGAAGMVGTQLGRALAHLRAEWDRCDKPRKRTTAQIEARAHELKDRRGKPDLRRATIEAITSHASALRRRAMTLSGRNLVIGLLTEFAQARGIDVDLVSPALFHWLAPACPACDGLGANKITDAPSLSKKQCNHCRGSGTWPRPHGAQELHDYMKTNTNCTRSNVKRKLYG